MSVDDNLVLAVTSKERRTSDSTNSNDIWYWAWGWILLKNNDRSADPNMYHIMEKERSSPVHKSPILDPETDISRLRCFGM
jgi:hypothetical protein